MEIYNERMELIEKPELLLGYLRPGTRTEHHAAVQGMAEQWHYETVAEYPNGGKDIRRVVDVPGVEARESWDEEIAIQIYTPYTQEELDRMALEQAMPSTEERLELLEEALEMILTGVTE